MANGCDKAKRQRMLARKSGFREDALSCSAACSRRRGKGVDAPGDWAYKPASRGGGLRLQAMPVGVVDWHCWEEGRDARAAARWCCCARGQSKVFERLAALSNEWPLGMTRFGVAPGGWLRMNMRV